MPTKPPVIDPLRLSLGAGAPEGAAQDSERIAIRGRYVACVARAIFLAGCMADAGNHDQSVVPGYRYHDANHTNVPGGNASPQAIYNATHGTWLWPPAENDKPNG